MTDAKKCPVGGGSDRATQEENTSGNRKLMDAVDSAYHDFRHDSSWCRARIEEEAGKAGITVEFRQSQFSGHTITVFGTPRWLFAYSCVDLREAIAFLAAVRMCHFMRDFDPHIPCQ